MSGRAGRRGMDDRGIVIFMVDEKMSPAVGKQLLKVQWIWPLPTLLFTYKLRLFFWMQLLVINPLFASLFSAVYTFFCNKNSPTIPSMKHITLLSLVVWTVEWKLQEVTLKLFSLWTIRPFGAPSKSLLHTVTGKPESLRLVFDLTHL